MNLTPMRVTVLNAFAEMVFVWLSEYHNVLVIPAFA